MTKLEDMPIVAVIASYAMLGDWENCLAAGCNGYTEKSIDPASIAGEVESFLAGES